MVGVVVVTHGDLGKACIEAVELIAGPQTNVKALGLHHGDSPDELEKQIMEALDQLEEGDGVLALVDFYGGTPANLVLKCMQRKKFPCVAGLNMPMLVEALTSRGGCTLEELEKNCRETGEKSFIELHEIYKKLSESSAE